MHLATIWRHCQDAGIGATALRQFRKMDTDRDRTVRIDDWKARHGSEMAHHGGFAAHDIDGDGIVDEVRSDGTC